MTQNEFNRLVNSDIQHLMQSTVSMTTLTALDITALRKSRSSKVLFETEGNLYVLDEVEDGFEGRVIAKTPDADRFEIVMTFELSLDAKPVKLDLLAQMQVDESEDDNLYNILNDRL